MSLINQDSNSPGIFRAYIIYKSGDEQSKIMIPGVHVNPVNSDYSLNSDIYEANKSTYPLATWNSKPMRNAIPSDKVLPGWITYENGDIKRPIILGYLGDGLIAANAWSGSSLINSSNSINGNSLSYNPGNILIITGHDNNTDKSVGKTGLSEADLTRELGKEIYNELEKLQSGITILYTNDKDHSFFVDASNGKLDNYDFSKFSGALEIHFNSGPGSFCLVRNERVNDNLDIETKIADIPRNLGFARNGNAVRQVSGNTNHEQLKDVEFLYKHGINLIYLETANMDSLLEMGLFNVKKHEMAKQIAKLLYDTYATKSVSSIINTSGWIYPLSFRAYPGSAGHFNDSRNDGFRSHAGIDLFTVGNGVNRVNEPVYACQSGVVTEKFDEFLETGVGSIAIKNDDGSEIRYGEVNSSLEHGDRVQRGQQIGYVPTNSAGNAMIHFEVYSGEQSGSLSDLSNDSNYKYVTPNYKTFKRRSDLCDPTFIQNIPLGK